MLRYVTGGRGRLQQWYKPSFAVHPSNCTPHYRGQARLRTGADHRWPMRNQITRHVLQRGSQRGIEIKMDGRIRDGVMSGWVNYRTALQADS